MTSPLGSPQFGSAFLPTPRRISIPLHLSMSSLVVSIPLFVTFQLNFTLTQSSQTVRIQAFFDCSLCVTGSSDCQIIHIQSEGLETAVLAVVPLWNGQLDLAVEQDSVEKVNDQFTNFTRYRLEANDPLFLPQPGYSQEQTALGALKAIQNQYRCAVVSDKSGDPTRIENWRASEMIDLDKRIKNLEDRGICLDM